MFPVDERTLGYLRDTGREPELLELVESYTRAQGLFRTGDEPRAGLLRDDRVRPRLGGAERGRAAPAAGPGRRSGTCRELLGRLRRRARQRQRAGRRLGRDRRHHQLHQHLQSGADDRRRPAGQEGGRARAGDEAVGEDQPGAGLAGGGRLPRPGRADATISTSCTSTWSATAAPPASATPARCPTMSPSEISEQRPVGGGSAVGQPQLRGPHPSAGARQLPGLAAAGGRFRAGRQRQHRPHQRAARHRPRRQPGDAGRDLAERRRGRAGGGGRRRRRPLPARVRPHLRRRRALARAAGAGRRAVRLGRRLHLRARGQLLRAPGRPVGHRRRPRAGAARRLGHHRPHLAGRLDPVLDAGRPLPDRARRRAARVQQLWRPPRQPRGDGARHLRQHPAATTASSRASRADSRATSPTASSCRSTTPRCATRPRACRWW